MPRRLSSQRGSVVLVALCFVAVLAISTTTYLALCGRALSLSARTVDADLGKQLAEAGVEAALDAFNTGNWSAWSISGTTATRTITFASTKYGNSGATGTIKLRVDNYDAFVKGAAYSSSTTYYPGELVGNGGMWYRSLGISSNKSPTTSASNSSIYWIPDQSNIGAELTWLEGETYAVGRLVNTGAGLYRCTNSHTAATSTKPGSGASWTSYWVNVPYLTADADLRYNNESIVYYYTWGWFRWDSPNSEWDSHGAGWTTTLNWSSGTTYSLGDVVFNAGWYRYINASPSSGNAVTNATFWRTNASDAALTAASWPWSSSATYKIGDVVYDAGSWYRCIREHTNLRPPNSTYWVNTPLRSPAWKSGRRYVANDHIAYNGVWYRCTNTHTSSTTILPTNTSYWSGAVSTSWSTATSYSIGNRVSYGGVWYRCIKAHVNTPINYRSPNDSEYWSAEVAPVIYVEATLTRPTTREDGTEDETLVRNQIRATVAVAPLFSNAVAATSSVTFASGGTVDSYDSSVGAYGGSNLGYAAVVAGGNTSADAVTMSGALVVNGYVAAPPAASSPHAALFTYNPSTTVVKGTSATPSPKVDATRVLRNPYIPTYDIHTVNGGMSLSSLAGVSLGTPGGTTPSIYTITGDVSLTSTLTIVGPVTLYVTGNLTLGSGGEIKIASTGSLVLRVDGNFQVNGASNGINNLTQDPKKNVVLLAKATTGTFSYSDTDNDFYGVIYLPNSASTLSFVNGFTMYGAVVAQTLNFTGNATIHYDIALRTAVIDGVDAPYVIADFRELPATEFADLDF